MSGITKASLDRAEAKTLAELDAKVWRDGKRSGWRSGVEVSTPITTEELDLDKLAELEKAATPGRLVYTSACANADHLLDRSARCWALRHAETLSLFRPTTEDGELFAALRNAAPALIQAARELAALKAEIAASKREPFEGVDHPSTATAPTLAEALANPPRYTEAAIREANGLPATPPTSNPEAIDLPTDEWRAMSPGIAVKGDVPL